MVLDHSVNQPHRPHIFHLYNCHKCLSSGGDSSVFVTPGLKGGSGNTQLVTNILHGSAQHSLLGENKICSLVNCDLSIGPTSVHGRVYNARTLFLEGQNSGVGSPALRGEIYLKSIQKKIATIIKKQS